MQTDPLKELLMNRTELVPEAPSGLPAPPPNPKQHESPAWQRYLTSLKMQDAVAGGWKISPTLVKVLEGR